MPREIDCPYCDGDYEFYECNKCNNGKIPVYTQSELNEAVKQAAEEERKLWMDRPLGTEYL